MAFTLIATGCHRAVPDRAVPARENVPVRENIPSESGLSREGSRTFNLQTPGQRDSLRAEIKKHREMWRAGGARDYDFLLRISCFCPGQKGWVLLEVRGGQTVQAWNSDGRPAPLTRDHNYNIDGLFDLLERVADRYDVVEVGFENQWHYPVYIGTDVSLGRPDDWGVFEVRGFRPRG